MLVLSFNGAAVLRPRKLARGLLNGINHERLQWGRGFEAAETATAGMGGVPDETGFNGAAVLRPRKQAIHEGKLSLAGRFNGAAVLRPRKPHDRTPVALALDWLQWGRGFEAAETARIRSCWQVTTCARCFEGCEVDFADRHDSEGGKL